MNEKHLVNKWIKIMSNPFVVAKMVVDNKGLIANLYQIKTRYLDKEEKGIKATKGVVFEGGRLNIIIRDIEKNDKNLALRLKQKNTYTKKELVRILEKRKKEWKNAVKKTVKSLSNEENKTTLGGSRIIMNILGKRAEIIKKAKKITLLYGKNFKTRMENKKLLTEGGSLEKEQTGFKGNVKKITQAKGKIEKLESEIDGLQKNLIGIEHLYTKHTTKIDQIIGYEQASEIRRAV